MISEYKPINEVELKYQEVGAEGYVTREYSVIIKSHDLNTNNLVSKAQEQLQKIAGMKK